MKYIPKFQEPFKAINPLVAPIDSRFGVDKMQPIGPNQILLPRTEIASQMTKVQNKPKTFGEAFKQAREARLSGGPKTFYWEDPSGKNSGWKGTELAGELTQGAASPGTTSSPPSTGKGINTGGATTSGGGTKSTKSTTPASKTSPATSTGKTSTPAASGTVTTKPATKTTPPAAKTQPATTGSTSKPAAKSQPTSNQPATSGKGPIAWTVDLPELEVTAKRNAPKQNPQGKGPIAWTTTLPEFEVIGKRNHPVDLEQERIAKSMAQSKEFAAARDKKIAYGTRVMDSYRKMREMQDQRKQAVLEASGKNTTPPVSWLDKFGNALQSTRNIKMR